MNVFEEFEVYEAYANTNSHSSVLNYNLVINPILCTMLLCQVLLINALDAALSIGEEPLIDKPNLNKCAPNKPYSSDTKLEFYHIKRPHNSDLFYISGVKDTFRGAHFITRLERKAN